MTRYFALVLVLLLCVPVQAAHGLNLHWKKRTTKPVTIFLVDRTQGRFPVRDVVHDWNGTGASHLVMTDECPDFRGCIVVRLRAMDYLGLTTLRHDGEHLTRVDVDVSSTRRMSASKRRSITCHEIGHSLGLDHRQANSSCLVNSQTFPLHPDEHDRQELRRTYAHVH